MKLNNPAPRRMAAALLVTAAIAAPGVRASAPASVSFGPGERLEFAIKFKGITAGHATMAVESAAHGGEAMYRLVSTATSTRFFSTFYPVNDRVVSLWSPFDLLPQRFEKHLSEGKYRKDVVVDFDHARGVAIYPDGEEAEMEPGSQDALSAFYYVRTQPLLPGDTVEIPNHSNGKNYPLQVEVLKRERVKVKAGEFDCVVIEPLLKTAGIFKQEGRLTIWITDDARRMPVLMKSKVPVGSVVAELEKYRIGQPMVRRGKAPVPAAGGGQ